MSKLLASSVVEVPLEDITVSKANAREFYDEEGLIDLQEGIGRVGQIYPVVLRRINDSKFELIVGSRRLKVAFRRKATTIPAFVVDDMSQQDMVILALTENLHRSDLTPFEEAKAILKLCKDFGMAPKDAAKRIGKPVGFVTGRLRILSLPEKVQTLLCKPDEGIAFSHVGVLSSLKRPKDQIRYAEIVAKQRLTKSDLVTLIQDEAGVPFRKRDPRLFTSKATALKIRRFDKFLDQRARPRLVLGGEEAREIRSALRQVRKTIQDILGHQKLIQK